MAISWSALLLAAPVGRAGDSPALSGITTGSSGDQGQEGTAYEQILVTLQNGDPTTLKLLYGTTPALGSESTDVDPYGRFHWSGGSDDLWATGLTLNTTYYYSVVVSNQFGTTTSPVASLQTTAPSNWYVPGSPTGVSAVAGNGAATISFTPPTNTGHLPLARYIVTAQPGGQGNIGASSPITVTGLSNGTSYTFTVVALNTGSGTSVDSAASNAVTPKPDAPGAPTRVTVVGGDGQATVGFAAPTSDGGGAISSYMLTATPASGSGAPIRTATGSGTPIIVSGLANGVAYVLALTASNSAGAGPASTISVTPASAVAGGGNGAATAGSSSGATTTTTTAGLLPRSTTTSSVSSQALPSGVSEPALSIAPIKIVAFNTKKPMLDVVATLAQAAVLHITLLNARDASLAQWTETGRPGKLTLLLPLPAKARKAGKYRLLITITQKGTTSRTSTPVTLRL